MSIEWDRKPCLYTISPHRPFADTLASGILEMAEGKPEELARYQVLLPTRRACRSLRDSFLKLSFGKPLLLPRLQPLGDVDDEELALMAGSADNLDLPPSIPPMRRRFLLARLIGASGIYDHGLEQDLKLADALARLMDQIYTENLDMAALPHIVDRDRFAEQWQISLDFLSLISEHWPRILQEQGVIDAADRRNRLLHKLSQRWTDAPPSHPVIAAGSTGSIPAAARLLKTIAGLPRGCIVLPGLDQRLDQQSWNALDDSHPQKTLRNLLQVFEVEREAVKDWPYRTKNPDSPEGNSAMPRLLSEVMRPAATSGEWQKLSDHPVISQADITFERYDCDTPQEEALVVAMAFRETLQTPGKTAALVTPDQNLARRVAMICRRWDIAVDDSAGEKLSHTPIGSYLLLCGYAAQKDFAPVALLSFAKHALCRPHAPDNWRGRIRDLDRYLMRGILTGHGIERYNVIAQQKRADKRFLPDGLDGTLQALEDFYRPLTDLMAMGDKQRAQDWCGALIRCAENFSDEARLWGGQQGEAASILIAELIDEASLLPMVTFEDFLSALRLSMEKCTVRPNYGLHPRLVILGQLEARLLQADVMVLASLNEKSWPPEAENDPWMSRPMRKAFGLPPPERGLGLSAHDFAQAMCAPRVIMTRSSRIDGTPTVPARWLQRLDAVLTACRIPPESIRRGKLLGYARAINHTDEYSPVERPAPRPPVTVRPRKLPVTQVERWLQDPYSIYARYILGLKKLDDLEKELDAAARGTLIHDALDRFVAMHPDDIPSNAERVIMAILDEELSRTGIQSDVIALWRPRLEKIAAWYVRSEIAWRDHFKPALRESEGIMTLQANGGDFIMTARADRIDLSRDGKEAAIIDYKSGGQYTIKQMMEGRLPQLPLEGLILQNGGFTRINPNSVAALSYWIMNGSKEGGEQKIMADANQISQAIKNAAQGIKDLIDRFDCEDTAYYSLPRPRNAPRFNDYEHLARVKEWTALDEQGDAS